MKQFLESTFFALRVWWWKRRLMFTPVPKLEYVGDEKRKAYHRIQKGSHFWSLEGPVNTVFPQTFTANPIGFSLSACIPQLASINVPLHKMKKIKIYTACRFKNRKAFLKILDAYRFARREREVALYLYDQGCIYSPRHDWGLYPRRINGACWGTSLNDFNFATAPELK